MTAPRFALANSRVEMIPAVHAPPGCARVYPTLTAARLAGSAVAALRREAGIAESVHVVELGWMGAPEVDHGACEPLDLDTACWVVALLDGAAMHDHERDLRERFAAASRAFSPRF